MSGESEALLRGGGAVTLVAAVAFAAFGSWHTTADFTQLWAITHASWSGISPYDEAAVRGLVPADATWPVLPWAYPPWTGLLFAPLGLLPLDVAGRLWMLLSAGAFLVGGVLASRARAVPDIALAAALGALSLPALGVIVVGQLVAPIAFAAALLVAGQTRAHLAIGLVLLATKPHLGAPIALAVTAQAAWRLDRRFLAGAGAGAGAGLALALAAFAIDPRWPAAWPAAVERLRRSDTVRLCDTCASATHTLSGSAPGAVALGALGLAAAAIVFRRRDLWSDRAAAVSAGALAALVFLPYVRNYDHALLTVPLLAAWGRADRPRRAALALAWLLPWLGVPFGRAGGTAFFWVAAVGVAAVWATLPARTHEDALA